MRIKKGHLSRKEWEKILKTEKMIIAYIFPPFCTTVFKTVFFMQDCVVTMMTRYFSYLFKIKFRHLPPMINYTCIFHLTCIKFCHLVLNSFPNKPCFYVSAVPVFRKYCGKKRIAHNEQVSFSHGVFYPFRELSAVLIKFEIIVCKFFSLRESKVCRLGKG